MTVKSLRAGFYTLREDSEGNMDMAYVGELSATKDEKTFWIYAVSFYGMERIVVSEVSFFGDVIKECNNIEDELSIDKETEAAIGRFLLDIVESYYDESAEVVKQINESKFCEELKTAREAPLRVLYDSDENIEMMFDAELNVLTRYILSTRPPKDYMR